jgi:hypothetical protein
MFSDYLSVEILFLSIFEKFIAFLKVIANSEIKFALIIFKLSLSSGRINRNFSES